MKELVIISGKGGTGKTSIVASFAALAQNSVFADCDVDAADLHLILDPQVERKEVFTAGRKAEVITDACIGCGKCQQLCLFDAVSFDGPANDVVRKTYQIDPISCEGCGVCHRFCPADAISFELADCGHWFKSKTRFGSMVHAKLGVAEDNSGKLVALVRNKARALAEEQGCDRLIVDGPPGIGCPVIASVTGASMVLIISEPTLSGLHDLERVRKLTRHFGIKTLVCVNKYDLNPEMGDQIYQQAQELGADVVGRVRYDDAVTRAQIEGKSVVEYSADGVAADIRKVWEQVSDALETVQDL